MWRVSNCKGMCVNNHNCTKRHDTVLRQEADQTLCRSVFSEWACPPLLHVDGTFPRNAFGTHKGADSRCAHGAHRSACRIVRAEQVVDSRVQQVVVEILEGTMDLHQEHIWHRYLATEHGGNLEVVHVKARKT